MNRRHLLLAGLAAIPAAAAAAQGATAPIRVATDATFPPFELVENGRMTGFDIQLVDAIAKTLDRGTEWTQIDFKGLVPGLVAGRFDMAASAIYITPERAKVVDFSDPYYTGGLVVLLRRDNTAIKGPDDLAGKRVTVQVGTKSVGYLRDTYPKIERVEVEKNEAMFDLVRIGRADAAVTGRPAALLYARANPEMQVLSPPLTSEHYGFAVRKDLPELLAGINRGLAGVRADGAWQTLADAWFGQG